MKKKEVYYHIIGWSLYWLYLILGQCFKATRANHPIFIYSYTSVQMIEFYVCYLWVYPSFLNKGKIPMLIGGLIVALACFIASRYLIEEVAFMYLFHMRNYFNGTTFSGYVLDNIYWGTSALILSAAVYSSFDALAKQQENRSLREAKTQAELSFLKTQINPHFLYNTLNYIYSQAYAVSDKLANAVIKLSQLMQYMLAESPDGYVDLQKEVDYIQNYISIYEMRFEDEFFVNFDTNGQIAGKRVAALILIPFVENAFKHGVVNNPERPVKIDLQVSADQLRFTVSDQINHDQKDHSTGVGLANIRRRLELIYPGKHDLLIANNGHTYKTTLIINM